MPLLRIVLIQTATDYTPAVQSLDTDSQVGCAEVAVRPGRKHAAAAAGHGLSLPPALPG